MTVDSLLAVVGIAFVAAITPGPCNMMLLANGANFGVRRSLPLVISVCLSFAVLLLVVGFGLGAVLLAHPAVHVLLKGISFALIVWMAWRIASAPTDPAPAADDEADGSGAQSFGIFQIALVNWLNPKAWAMAMAVTVAYAQPHELVASLLLICLVYTMVNLPVVGSWAAFGGLLRRWLSDPRRRRVFNVAMAALLIVAVLPVVLDVVPLQAGQ